MATVALGQKAVGSVVKLKFNGAMREFLVVHQGRPSTLYDASCDGTWLLMKDCLEAKRWHSSNVNDYANSEVHGYLNSTVLSKFDADIQAQIKQVKIPYRPGSGTSGTVNSGASGLSTKIFLLSDREVGFTKSNINQYICDDGAKLAYFIEEGNTGGSGCQKRIAYFNGSAVLWWLRSPRSLSSDNAWYVHSSGSAGRNSCSSTGYYLRPALILPSNLLTSDDGTINTNTAPTTPASITIPESIQGGSTITVQWGTSTDAESNLEGYVVERSTNGGGSWMQIYQGSATSTTNTVPAGTETIMYRVKAYDSEGLYSGYRTSGQITVINNNAPGIPASITIPNEVLGGKPLTITWGAATDVDGDLAGYALERQVDGGDSWTEVYRGSNLSYTDAVTRGWASVCYRVRAYDSHNAYGGYATSQSRPVNNNIAPVITCSQASGADLGTKTSGFSVAYSVADPDGDSMTVTEAIDGVTKRTFTPEAGANNAFAVTGEVFMCLLNGDHTLTITANDGKGSTVHTLTFTKEIHAASITLAEPLDADAKIEICVLSVLGSLPADAVFSVKVTNNANDTTPVWEDCTAEVKAGANHVFTNTTATNGFAFNFKIEVERGASGEGGYISSAQGGFQ